MRVYRAAEDRWYDLGTVSSIQGRWREWLEAVARARPRLVFRYRYRGRDVERPTY